MTPRYRLEIHTPGHHNSPMAWRTNSKRAVKGYGRPTGKNLATWVLGFEESTKEGGCNAHLGETKVSEAYIIDQDTQATVATYKANSK